MIRTPTSLLLLLAMNLVALKSAAAITIDTVPVNNVGNTNDPSDGDISTAGIQNFGAVNYAYRISTNEVTVGQYVAFLNAVAKVDTYGLFNPEKAGENNAAILRNGISANYTYSVIGANANKPVVIVSWQDAVRFCNWLHNGQPTGNQNSSTTEDGAYVLNGANTTLALSLVTRNAGAKWFLPTENEWYKAAYHQPATKGGDVDDYWLYPTRTNSESNSDQPPGDPSIQANAGNFFRDDSLANGYNDGHAVTGSLGLGNETMLLTNVGAYTGSASPYGAFDMGGNVWEWTETLNNGNGRVYRGGSWGGPSIHLRSSDKGVKDPGDDLNILGFRVATVPEPTTLALAALGALGLLIAARRKR